MNYQEINNQSKNESVIEELHTEAVHVAASFHKSESRLISILQEMDGHSQFRKLQCSSLFDCGVRILKLSESNTLNFIAVARKSKIVPQLKKAIDDGILTVSKARKITPVITPENQSHWISLAQGLSKDKLEKEVARVCPKEAVTERAQFVSGDRIKLTLGISEEILNLLKRVQDLESQRTGSVASYEDTIKQALEFYISKLDPVEKAKRAEAKHVSSEHVPGHAFIPFHRQAILTSLKHKVNLRDKRKCSHDGCGNSRWIEIHHVIPISQGGTNELSNLKTLCSSHHRQLHERRRMLLKTTS